jgi:hypothetical protein
MTNVSLLSLVVLTIITVVAGTVYWMSRRPKVARLGYYRFLIPIIVIAAITFIQFQQTFASVLDLRTKSSTAKQQLLEEKWACILLQLDSLQQESFMSANSMMFEIINAAAAMPDEEVVANLTTIGSNNYTPLQAAIDAALRGREFRGVATDSSTPFAMLIGKTDEDSYIFSSAAASLAVTTLQHPIAADYSSLAYGNEAFATVALGRLLTMQPGYPVESSIILKEGPRQQPVTEPYTLTSLHKVFIETEGDITKTFESIAFLAPKYIYRDGDLTGALRIINRVKTDAKAVAVVSKFSYLEVLSRDPLMRAALSSYDKAIFTAQQTYILEERGTLVTGILIMLVIFILLIYLWIFMHIDAERRKDF